MKTRLFGILLVLGLSASALFAGADQNEKFKVAGNCGMCETRIEKAVKGVDGVSSAEWDKETKMVAVSFDPSKTDLHKIHMAIAEAGHDTELHTASNETYEKLPACCKYERIKPQEAGHMHE